MAAEPTSPGPRTVQGKLRGAAKAAPRTLPDPPRRILLASTGVPFSHDVIAKAIALATPEHAKITVLTIAHIYGTSLGLPHPGLKPNRLELAEQARIVEEAAGILRRKGFEVRVQVSRSRNAAKMIAKWAKAKSFHAIVVPDPERPRWRRTIEGDLAREIERRCLIPVHAVPVPAPRRRRALAG